jgi:hypothetical protein
MAYLYDSKSPERITHSQRHWVANEGYLHSLLYTTKSNQMVTKPNQTKEDDIRCPETRFLFVTSTCVSIKFGLVQSAKKFHFFQIRIQHAKGILNWNDNKFPVSEELARVCYTKLSCLIILQVHITVA